MFNILIKLMKGFKWPARILLIIVMLVLLGYWYWDKIENLPGAQSLITRMKPLPHAVSDSFTIAVVHLDNDINSDSERILIEALSEFRGINVMRIDRVIAPNSASIKTAIEEGHKQARLMLDKIGADVLIWGKVLKQGGDKSTMKLFWTTYPELSLKKSEGRYRPTKELNLPELFWKDLVDLLGLLVINHGVSYTDLWERHDVNKLNLFVDRVQTLLNHQEKRWDVETRTQIKQVLADSLITLGIHSGRKEAFREAVEFYREALRGKPRNRFPLDWAHINEGLGAALGLLGEREPGTARLKEAETCYREAIIEYTKHNAETERVFALQNLAVILGNIAYREASMVYLGRALAYSDEALKVFNRERFPLQWAYIQHNRGNYLKMMGELNESTATLEESVSTLQEVLKVRTVDNRPIDWAITQGTLCSSLLSLGIMESESKHLRKAATACREALTVLNPERLPMEYSVVQYNLGSTLGELAELECNKALARESLAALRKAKQYYCDEPKTLLWAAIENNTGSTLMWLGMNESDIVSLELAAQAFLNALEIYRREHNEKKVQRTEKNLSTIHKAIHEIRGQ